jgi:hypothetical protein
MTAKMFLYDPKCGELARHFLDSGASDKHIDRLAFYIQQNIEDWLENNEDIYEDEDAK